MGHPRVVWATRRVARPTHRSNSRGCPSKLRLGGGVRWSQTARRIQATLNRALGTQALSGIPAASLPHFLLLRETSEAEKSALVRHLCSCARTSTPALRSSGVRLRRDAGAHPLAGKRTGKG